MEKKPKLDIPRPEFKVVKQDDDPPEGSLLVFVDDEAFIYVVGDLKLHREYDPAFLTTGQDDTYKFLFCDKGKFIWVTEEHVEYLRPMHMFYIINPGKEISIETWTDAIKKQGERIGRLERGYSRLLHGIHDHFVMKDDDVLCEVLSQCEPDFKKEDLEHWRFLLLRQRKAFKLLEMKGELPHYHEDLNPMMTWKRVKAKGEEIYSFDFDATNPRRYLRCLNEDAVNEVLSSSQ